MLAVSQGDFHGKFRSNALLRGDADGAIHQLHNSFRDGEAETTAAKLCLSGTVLPGEGFENFRKILLLHANARILDAEAKRRLVINLGNFFDGKQNASRRIRKFDGI